MTPTTPSLPSLADIKAISVVGAGSWGTAVAHLLATKGYDVLLWARETEVREAINAQHQNPLFHANLQLDARLRASNDLAATLRFSPLIVLAVPTQYIRATLKPVLQHLGSDKTIVSISKGIENGTLMTVSQLLNDLQPALKPAQIGVLSGPSFAIEVLRGMPTALCMACPDEQRAKSLQQVFHTPYFRTYSSTDQLGVELGGAMKNVIAIGVGVIEGLGFGFNARAALITRALAEMTRLAVTMRCAPQTLAGLAGVGDLILTCTSDLSRNRSLGLKIGAGAKLEELLNASPMVVEGVETARSAYQLAKRHHVEMPITEQVYQVLHEGKSPLKAAHDLLARDPKAEF